jgi:hypothetical protein
MASDPIDWGLQPTLLRPEARLTSCSSRLKPQTNGEGIQPTAPLSLLPPRRLEGALSGFTIVVTKSTVPVGTAEKIKDIMAGKNERAEFAVASNPEFLRQGSAVDDFLRPDRIGVENERTKP